MLLASGEQRPGTLLNILLIYRIASHNEELLSLHGGYSECICRLGYSHGKVFGSMWPKTLNVTYGAPRGKGYVTCQIWDGLK